MKKYWKSFGFYAVLLGVLTLFAYMLLGTQPTAVEKVYSDLFREIEAGRVTELTIVDNKAYAKLSEPIKITDTNGKVISDKVDKIEVDIPNMLVFEQDLGETIRAQVRDGKLKYDTEAPVSQPWWLSLLPFSARWACWCLSTFSLCSSRRAAERRCRSVKARRR